MRKDLDLITNLPDEYQQASGLDLYIESIRAAIHSMLPESLFNCTEAPRTCILKLLGEVPLIDWSIPKQSPPILSFSTLVSSEFSQGLGRYLIDVFNRKLLPGTLIPIPITRSLNFEFRGLPKHYFFFSQIFLDASNVHNFTLLEENLASLSKEVRLNIMAVQHARRVVSMERLTIGEKERLIKENVATLTQNSNEDFEEGVFGQMHNVVMQASKEKNLKEIKEKFSPLNNKAAVRDPDIFKDFQNFTLRISENFIAKRSPKHIRRIISYQFLFRKSLIDLVGADPSNRHFRFKIFQVQHTDSGLPVLGVVVVFNRLSKGELFDKEHLMSALSASLGDMEMVEDSFFVADRDGQQIRSFYIEVKKCSSKRFTLGELKKIRRDLPREIQCRTQSIAQQMIFIHRNEEEVMRGILNLSNQLKYVHDIPQVIVTFHKQGHERIFFTVILLRLLKSSSSSMRSLLSENKIEYKDLDIKTVGLLRKKYPKEAVVFDMSLPKSPFTREDFSLDIYKAREAVIDALSSMCGEVRDFNGGMISKQNEVLIELKKQVRAGANELLLENFFYSLAPNYMQNLLPLSIIESFFNLLMRSLDQNFKSQPYSIMKETFEDHFMILLATTQPNLKNRIRGAVDTLTFSTELTSSSQNFFDIDTQAYLIRTDTKEEVTLLEKTIEEAVCDYNAEQFSAMKIL